MKIVKLSSFQKFKAALSILLNLAMGYVIWADPDFNTLLLKVFAQLEFIIFGILFIFYKPKWWEKTKFSDKDFVGWIRNFLLVFTFSYLLSFILIIFTNFGNFSLKFFFSSSLLGAVLLSSLLIPLLLSGFFILQFVKKLIETFR